MNNTEKQATFGTQNTERRQSKEKNKHNTEKKKDEQHEPYQERGEPRRLRTATSSCLL